MKIFCIMRTGKFQITTKVADVLFQNAHDMLETGNQSQRIKGKDYDGIITSKFETIVFVGTAGVLFEAEIVTPKHKEVNKINYFVRNSDLEDVEKAEWFGTAEAKMPAYKWD